MKYTYITLAILGLISSDAFAAAAEPYGGATGRASHRAQKRLRDDAAAGLMALSAGVDTRSTAVPKRVHFAVSPSSVTSASSASSSSSSSSAATTAPQDRRGLSKRVAYSEGYVPPQPRASQRRAAGASAHASATSSASATSASTHASAASSASATSASTHASSASAASAVDDASGINTKATQRLIDAVIARDVGFVKASIAARIDVNGKGDTLLSPLHWAVEKRSDAAAVLLLRAGADTEVRDPQGNTPIIRAASRGAIIVIEHLVEKRANMEARDACGNTPLLCAMRDGKIKAMERLLELGADPNVENNYGDSPLSIAARKGILKTTKTLLNAGADASLANSKGETPVMAAEAAGRAAIVQFLKRRIAYKKGKRLI